MGTQVSKATLLASIATSFPDNTAGNISPAILRAWLENLVESIFFLTDHQPEMPLYGYKIVSGAVYWNGSQFAQKNDTQFEPINTGGTITTNADHIALDAGSTVGKWVFGIANLHPVYGESYDLLVELEAGGDAIKIYPKQGGHKIEIANLEYQSGWQLLAGAQSTMAIGSSSDNQINLTHEDCGNNPAWLTPRATGRELSASLSIGATTTTVELRDEAGNTFTPAAGERVSIARLSASKSQGTNIDPSQLTSANGMVHYFAIYKE